MAELLMSAWISIGEFCAMDCAKIHGELTRNPAKMFVLVHEEGIKSKITNAFQRVKSEPEEAGRAVRSRRCGSPIMVKSDD
jgi:hypothetical protein